MALLRPTPWTSQPQQTCEIDPSSGFKYAWTATGAGTNPYQANTDYPVVSAGGLALRITSNVQQMLATDSGIGLQGGTFLFHGKSMFLVACGEFGILDTAASINSRAGCHLPFTDGTVYFDFGGADTGTTRLNVSGLTFSESDVFILTTGPRGMEIWQNGILRASNSANPTRTASGYPFGLGGNNYSLSGGRDLRCKLFAYSPNQITVQQVKSISANPWQIFKPLPRRIFAPVATSSDHLIIGANNNQTNTASDGAVGQTHLATISNSTQANTTAQAAIQQTHLVSVAPSNQSNVASDASISQSAITLVTVANSNQANTTSDAGIQQAHLATSANSAQANASSDAAIQQTHLVAAASSNQANVASPASITQTLDKYVSAADSTQANTASAGSIQQAHLIQCAGVAIDNVASASAVVQEHLLTAANSVQGNVASAGSAITILPTIGRPTADVSNAGWAASTGSDLYAMLDDVTPEDADYISTSTLGAVCKMALNATQYPGSAAQQLSLRASSSTGNGLSVTIKDGATTIATRSLTLTPTYDLHTITLTAGEIAAITSGNLTVEMTSI